MRGFFVSDCSVGKVLDLYLSLGKGRDDFQFTAHGADIVAQRADVHVGASLHFGDRRLVDM
ncbi:hypothetical protein D3C72_2493260 [compost metagenome]